ncbi:ArsR family transcriptional regulator [Acetatifactor muris]|uniref:ArsR family transcriptional regulator n=1 Tax=Acetatifactor muris TaxID=879566 RepID=UPI0011AF2592|nr:ArsR family transcriptional regulator [Lachnospiraceae bacterium]
MTIFLGGLSESAVSQHLKLLREAGHLRAGAAQRYNPQALRRPFLRLSGIGIPQM